MRPNGPRSSLLLSAALLLALAAPGGAQAPPMSDQMPPRGQAPPPPGAPQQAAPVKPYQTVKVTLPAPVRDASFDAFRKQLGEVARKKDRAALAKLVVAKGFFWESEQGDKADKTKSGLDDLSAAIGGLSGQQAPGWDVLAAVADEASLEAAPNRQGMMCGPAAAKFDEKALEALTRDTGTDPGEWGYPIRDGVDVRASGQPNAQVVEKLGLHLVRVLPDTPPAGNAQDAPPFLRVATPSGKTGFVSTDLLAPLAVDQLCYVKDAGGWKIAGFVGGQ